MKALVSAKLSACPHHYAQSGFEDEVLQEDVPAALGEIRKKQPTGTQIEPETATFQSSKRLKSLDDGQLAQSKPFNFTVPAAVLAALAVIWQFYRKR